ncbi:hypothetical protein V512_005530 [Mesotoga sp. Brook.08.105.5.1]|nr:hypothetical protein V512_005530 [Mesotoga sp. Brook.08.105.5.1]
MHLHGILPLRSAERLKTVNPLIAGSSAVRLKAENPLYAGEDNVVRPRSAVYREERFKRLREFLNSCSYNSQLASWNLQLSVLENGEPITDNHFLIQPASWNLQLFAFFAPKKNEILA